MTTWPTPPRDFDPALTWACSGRPGMRHHDCDSVWRYQPATAGKVREYSGPCSCTCHEGGTE